MLVLSRIKPVMGFLWREFADKTENFIFGHSNGILFSVQQSTVMDLLEVPFRSYLDNVYQGVRVLANHIQDQCIQMGHSLVGLLQKSMS